MDWKFKLKKLYRARKADLKPLVAFTIKWAYIALIFKIILVIL